MSWISQACLMMQWYMETYVNTNTFCNSLLVCVFTQNKTKERDAHFRICRLLCHILLTFLDWHLQRRQASSVRQPTDVASRCHSRLLGVFARGSRCTRRWEEPCESLSWLRYRNNYRCWRYLPSQRRNFQNCKLVWSQSCTLCEQPI